MFGMGFGEMVMVVGIWFLPLSLVVILAWRFIRAYEGRGAARLAMEQTEERLLRLEEAVATFGEELDQLSEAQRFTAQVLAGRAILAARKTEPGS